MELKKTHCERFVTDENGNPVSVVKKNKLETFEEAQLIADEHNIKNKKKKEHMSPYHCGICKKYHVGRTGREVSFDDVDKIWDRKLERKYRAPDFKIVGKIDLSKFEKTVKIKKSGKKKIRYK